MKISTYLITVIILLSLVLLEVPNGSCLEVSCRAIKVRESEEYSPTTAWELGYTGKGIVIAVIDSGVDDVVHESLKDKFIAGVDFTKPFNPITNPDDGSVNPDDNYGHGTLVAGIVMGTGGIEKKYMGVAPNAKLVDVKLGYGAISKHKFAAAIQWCIDHKDTDWDNNGPSPHDGIDIISCSQATGEDNSNGQCQVSQITIKAVEAGIVFVCAAGNDGDEGPGFNPPAAADKVICVGDVDDKNTVNRSDDEIWMEENGGSCIGPRADDGDDDHYDELKPDVVAPGEEIISAKYNTQDEYREASGTSFSGPHVAGVVALMLEANPDLKPTPDRNSIQEILRKTAESKGTPDSDLEYEGSDSYYNYSYGWGIVDAYKAVKAAEAWSLPQPNHPPTITINKPENNAEVSNTIIISGTASDSDGNATSVELRIDTEDWFNVSINASASVEWSYEWNTAEVEDGEHTIYARSWDGENYSSVYSITARVINQEKETHEGRGGFIPGFETIWLMLAIGVALIFCKEERYVFKKVL